MPDFIFPETTLDNPQTEATNVEEVKPVEAETVLVVEPAPLEPVLAEAAPAPLDPVPAILERISLAISPKFANDLLAVREPRTPDRPDLACVLLVLAREHARTIKDDRALTLLEDPVV